MLTSLIRASTRPSLLRAAATPPSLLSSQWIRTLFIQTEETPNDHALKFLPSLSILPDGETIEYLSGRQAHASPLARRLFAVDGIKTVMFGPNFITVEKKPQMNWMLIKPEVFSILTESLTSGEPLFDESELPKDAMFDDDDDDVVAMIKELIFTRIRPAIQEDGGDLEFVNFEEDSGTVWLRLRGACRSCDSSSVTLKNGIESMLKHYIEEVEEVKQIDEEEETEVDPLPELKKMREHEHASASRQAPPPPNI
ncbi:CYFA0S01e06920g1_1 [Cyberlindnera fabianii]|uniref:CYFA0S01e06920g1_1 n=1 Tax=Cyberlindnera fabianii TaxID=36022 RepID=A0A061AHM2_CYBFA|nr:CYFA0S01e06920g1_1 [Cyberlindnera fabianii]